MACPSWVLWPLLCADMLFWGLVAPLIALLVWLPLLLLSRVRPPSSTFHLKVATPWNVVVHMYVMAHGLSIFDADGAAGIFLPGIAELRGAFLMNHRSWGDFALE